MKIDRRATESKAIPDLNWVYGVELLTPTKRRLVVATEQGSTTYKVHDAQEFTTRVNQPQLGKMPTYGRKKTG